MLTERELRVKWKAVAPFLNERGRRRWAGAEAASLGYGGVALVSRVTGMAFNTIKAGQRELGERSAARVSDGSRSRKAGAGRKPLSEGQPELIDALESLVAPNTRGDPMSPLLWTHKSTTELADALGRDGHSVSAKSVARLLRQAGYSLQALRKTREGKQHPDRDAQFRHIQRSVLRRQRQGHPVISIDCKKKELIGDFKNGGREWQPKEKPETVRVHDFPDKQLGKAIPYGIYDIFRNEGWVSVGIDHETADFATESILRWWRQMGTRAYRGSRELMIVADGGGANGSRRRSWKVSLQQLANNTGLTIHMSHLPPGTSKWNKIEHRMFCHITQNWRGRPLVSQEVVVNLIASTKTKTGLKIRAAIDPGKYPIGIKFSEADVEDLNLTRDKFHGEWNYTVAPIEVA
jgi:Rhodopirellula transposase DDE domain